MALPWNAPIIAADMSDSDSVQDEDWLRIDALYHVAVISFSSEALEVEKSCIFE